MGEKREFHLGAVLSIATGRLVTLNGMGGIYEILNFMTRDNLFTHQIPRAMTECQPWLLRQHPQLGTGEMAAAVDALDSLVEAATEKTAREDAVRTWLSRLVARYGETLPVEPIPPDKHAVIDPIEEARRMAPNAEIVIVKTPPTP